MKRFSILINEFSYALDEGKEIQIETSTKKYTPFLIGLN